MDNELLRFARLAIGTARRAVPPRLSRHAGPTYHPANLPATLLLREHLRQTYRGAEDLLRLSDRPPAAARAADRARPLDPVVVRAPPPRPGPRRARAGGDRGARRRPAPRSPPGRAGLDRAAALARLALLRAAGRARPRAAGLAEVGARRVGRAAAPPGAAGPDTPQRARERGSSWSGSPPHGRRRSVPARRNSIRPGSDPRGWRRRAARPRQARGRGSPGRVTGRLVRARRARRQGEGGRAGSPKG
jgi:translation initiation factor IF-2